MKGELILLKYLLPIYLIFSLLITVPFVVYAEEVVIEDWAAIYNGQENGDDEPTDIAVDLSGNVYVTGTSYGNKTRDDFSTVKYDANGSKLWVRRYNGPGILIDEPGDGNDSASAIAVDSAGNVYVTGWSWAFMSNKNYCTIKYDTDGNQLWAEVYYGLENGDDEPTDIAVDSSGNVYVTGKSQIALGESCDYATVKYDTNGEQLWARSYNGGGDGNDEASSIAVDSSGNVYVAGKSYDSETGYDYATVKYDTNGNQLWVKRYCGKLIMILCEDGDDEAIDIAIDSSGNIYVTGKSYHSKTGYDYATVKYNTNGNLLWEARYTSPGNSQDEAAAIAVDSSGNVYVTGSSNIVANSDYTTVKYDTNGNQLWVKQYNGSKDNHDSATDIAVDSSGNVYVTGKSYGHAIETGYDYATVKYDTNGNQLWVKQYDGLKNSNDEATALAVDSSGNVYVTGKSYDDATGYDYATVKYKNTIVAPDEFEPDDDPNQILREIYLNDVSHKIIVNDPPQMHTFYCEDTNGCIDIDFVYFYGIKGNFYEIYATDLSENNYHIQLSLYDTNIQILYENGYPMISNNYLAFQCNQSGYYLIMTQSDPDVESKYISFDMQVISDTVEQYGTILLKVIVPQGSKRPCVKWRLKGNYNSDFLQPGGYLFIYPDTHYYKINKPDGTVTIKVYDQCGEQCSGQCNEPPLAETSVVVSNHKLNKATIDLSTVPSLIEPDPKYSDDNYNDLIDQIKTETENTNYPWANITLSDDMDPNFPQEKDYDGDQISNLDEIACYGSNPHYPTFILSLHQGLNLFYFPSINTGSNIISSDDPILSCYYDDYYGTWYHDYGPSGMESNTFNAIYTPSGGTLSLDLKKPNYAVFCLRWPQGLEYFSNYPDDDEIEDFLKDYEYWSQCIKIDGTMDPNFPTLRWDTYRIASNIGPAALINGDPNRPELLVEDMSTNGINNYKTKLQDKIDYLPSISVPLFSYAIMPYNRAFDLTIDIPAGWSMISLPIIPNSAKVSNIFPDAKVVYGYEIGKGYVRVDNNEELQARKGYWILIDTNRSYVLTGRPILPNPLSVDKNGWDMIGGLSFKAPVSIDNGSISVLYCYNQKAGYQRINESEYLEPGKGYWMLVKGISN